MPATATSLFRRSILPATLLLVASALVACGGDGPTGPGSEGDPVDRVATVAITPGSDTLTALGDTRTLDAVALDSNGEPVSGVTFTWSSGDESVATVDGGGVVSAEGNGTAEISASVSGSGVSGSARMAVIQQVSTVSVSPGTATLTTVGATQQFTATAVDANDNPVEGVQFVWASENHAVATVDSDGLASATGSGSATITATAQDIPGHAALTVNQEIAALSFRTQPTSGVAGDAIDPAVQVAVLDGTGNLVEDAELAVTLSLGANPGSGTLGGTRTVNATAGVATFSGLWVDAVGTGYTLSASAAGSVSGAESTPFDISVGAAEALAIVTQPTDATAGAAISPAMEVQVQDGFGNPVSGSTAEVNVAIENNPTGTTLGGTTAVAASGGVATFDALTLEAAATGYTLRATSQGLDADVTTSFDVTAGAAAQVAFVTEPADGEGLEPLAPAVQVAVQDAFGNTVTGSTASVTLSLAADASETGATLGGTLSQNASQGIATFPDLTIDVPGTGYRLEASSASLTATRSDFFSVDLTFAQISPGVLFTCGVTTAEHAYCWGYNGSGQVGDGTTTDRWSPVAVQTDQSFVQISAGTFHTCALNDAGEAYCWGSNGGGRLGDGSETQSYVPVPVQTPETFVDISAGSGHSCALTAGDQAYCWGQNTYGSVGDNSTTDRTTPVPVTGGYAFVSLDAGGSATCAITSSNELYCWGRNDWGQIGDGTTVNRLVPTAPSTAESFTQVSQGGAHACAVTTTGDPLCWGRGTNGQLGDGADSNSTTPVAVSTPETFAQVTAGNVHSCGVTTSDEPFCWGWNGSGQLGDGGLVDPESWTPVAVANPVPFTNVRAGSDQNCVITTSRGVLCWGDNQRGQVGLGHTADVTTPTRIIQ